MTRATLLTLVVLLAPSFAQAQSCPAPLGDARKLVLVTSDTLSSNTASLQTFSRANVKAPWRASSGPVTALIGHNGVGWSYGFRQFAAPGEPIKVDGDKRVPAGFFRIGRPFGFAASRRPHYLHITEGMTCVDDSSVARLQHHHLARQSGLGGAWREHVACSGIPPRPAGRLPDQPQGARRLLHLHPYAAAGRDRHVWVCVAAGAAGGGAAGLCPKRRRFGGAAAAGAKSLQRMSA